MAGGGMNFELTDDQQLIRKSVAELASKFDDHYWMEKDQAHEFPQEFYDAISSGGWLGMTIPEEYGGHGLGITEAQATVGALRKSAEGHDVSIQALSQHKDSRSGSSFAEFAASAKNLTGNTD